MWKRLYHSYATAEEEIIFPSCKQDMNRAWRVAHTDCAEAELQNTSQSLSYMESHMESEEERKERLSIANGIYSLISCCRR